MKRRDFSPLALRVAMGCTNAMIARVAAGFLIKVLHTEKLQEGICVDKAVLRRDVMSAT